ncbi:MAG TPA: metallophosphoesterase [Polyangiaceae bacterium]|nr:metallophosphoesterase [Polyangiaceae bacterium]
MVDLAPQPESARAAAAATPGVVAGAPWQRFVKANVVQLTLVVSNAIAHAVLGWVGVAWFGLTWWPWLLVPFALLSGLLTLQTCFPDRHVGSVTRLLREALMVYTSTLIVATPLVLLAAVLPALALPDFDATTLESFVQIAAPSAYAAAFLLAGWAIVICRRWVRVTDTAIPLAHLPREFDGYTIAHLSDLHVGSTDSKVVALKWVALANRCAPDLIVITGDLVTKGSAFYRDVCDVVAELRARDGVCVCLGNHDLHDADALASGLERAGALVLRDRWHAWVRGGARLIVAGVDPGGSLEATLGDRPRDGYTVLLAHYPAMFERTRGWGVGLMLSGHTHGGQVGIPWFGDKANVATFTGQRGRGLAESGASRLFVSAGLGTTGVPFRLGVRPEMAYLRLRCAPPTLSRTPARPDEIDCF